MFHKTTLNCPEKFELETTKAIAIKMLQEGICFGKPTVCVSEPVLNTF